MAAEVLFVAAQARFRPRPLRPSPGAEPPAVTVVLAVRNEVGALRRRVENLLAQAYPVDRLRVLVACNGSVDGTWAAAGRLADDLKVLLAEGPDAARAVAQPVEDS